MHSKRLARVPSAVPATCAFAFTNEEVTGNCLNMEVRMEIQTDAKQGAGLESLPPACQARKPSPISQGGQVNNQGEVWQIGTQDCDSESPWKSPAAATNVSTLQIGILWLHPAPSQPRPFTRTWLPASKRGSIISQVTLGKSLPSLGLNCLIYKMRWFSYPPRVAIPIRTPSKYVTSSSLDRHLMCARPSPVAGPPALPLRGSQGDSGSVFTAGSVTDPDLELLHPPSVWS